MEDRVTQDKNRELVSLLRTLRKQARSLRATLKSDLESFQKDDDGSFFTLPDSDKVGISIASSCTALMALSDPDTLEDLDPHSSDSAEASSAASQASPAAPVPLQEKPSSTPGSVGAPQGQTAGASVISKTEVSKPAGEDASAPSDRSSPSTTAQTVGKKAWARTLFENIVKAEWKTSGLKDLNAFSTSMVMRAAGFLVASGTFDSAEVASLVHPFVSPIPAEGEEVHDLGVAAVAKALDQNPKPSLQDIALAVASSSPASFRVQKYPPKTTMAYWFIDGVSKASINIDAYWDQIAIWAIGEFHRQLSYVVSNNDALMDPAELAMAACLIKRSCSGKESLSAINEKLPLHAELLSAISRVFDKQADSGIWNKYFPMFHFPGSGAADYCFSFEFLEAVLVEFSEYHILTNKDILHSVAKAVRWCDNNRLNFRDYSGWNAGGDVSKLAAGKPEAWSTASVHMFLWELESGLSTSLQKLILGRFPRVETFSRQKWDELIDVDITFPGEQPTTLKKIIEKELIKPALGKSELTIRKGPLSSRRSALLFGPPGTSKTTFAKALAGRLDWPLIVITPSEFLSKGLEQIYVRATEIFEDLMDLARVVVFFDEMDALAQTRGNATLDVTRQLLTTSMLPKLGDLYDHATVLFLMATNHKKDLDPAIIRPARFDLLLCVGPPSWEYKLAGIRHVLRGLPVGAVDKVRASLKEFSNSLAVRQQLDIFTVGDLRSFLESLRRKNGKDTLADAIASLNADSFQAEVATWHKGYITLAKLDKHVTEEMDLLTEYDSDKLASRIQ
jgi:ATPase family protein associated with various cellular activities (AAA)